MPDALSVVVALRHERLITEALLQALPCLFAHIGFEVEEGLQSEGFQEGPSPFAEGLGGLDCVLAVLASEISVTKIELNDCFAALADEGEAWVAEAGLYGFQGKGLGAAGMGEFYRIAGESQAG